MTVTDPFTVAATKRRPDPVECPDCGGEVLPVGWKVGPHNVHKVGPLVVDGRRVFDRLGKPRYVRHIDDTELCPGGGQAPAGRVLRRRTAPKVPEDVLRRLVEEEHLTDKEVAARLGCDESTVRKARQRAVPPIGPGRGNPTLAGYVPPLVGDQQAAA